MPKRSTLVFLALTAISVLLMASDLSCHGLTICKMEDAGFESCRPAVTAGQPNPADPSEDCCKALSGADLACFCSYKDSPLLPTLGIDPGLCMALPAKCGIQASSDC